MIIIYGLVIVFSMFLESVVNVCFALLRRVNEFASFNLLALSVLSFTSTSFLLSTLSENQITLLTTTKRAGRSFADEIAFWKRSICVSKSSSYPFLGKICSPLKEIRYFFVSF